MDHAKSRARIMSSTPRAIVRHLLMVTGTHRLRDMAIDRFIEERHETESTLTVVVSVEVVMANDQVLDVPEGLQKLTQRCFRNQW